MCIISVVVSARTELTRTARDVPTGGDLPANSGERMNVSQSCILQLSAREFRVKSGWNRFSQLLDRLYSLTHQSATNPRSNIFTIDFWICNSKYSMWIQIKFHWFLIISRLEKGFEDFHSYKYLAIAYTNEVFWSKTMIKWIEWIVIDGSLLHWIFEYYSILKRWMIVSLNHSCTSGSKWWP